MSNQAGELPEPYFKETAMGACEHIEFEAEVDVLRLLNSDGKLSGFSTDTRVKCSQCGERFVFMGVPVGWLANEPAVSFDGYEVHMPLRPESAPDDFGLGLLGYTVNEVKRD